MKIKPKEKYLGEIIHLGVSESVNATVSKRKGLAILSINDIISIIHDSRAEVTGKIETGVAIFEHAVLPYLLNSSDTWLEIPKKTL